MVIVLAFIDCAKNTRMLSFIVHTLCTMMILWYFTRHLSPFYLLEALLIRGDVAGPLLEANEPRAARSLGAPVRPE